MDLEHKTDHDRMEQVVKESIPGGTCYPYGCCAGSGGLLYEEPASDDS